MSTLLLVLVTSVGAVLLWTLLSPRSQWRMFASWSYRNAHADEPSHTAYFWYRVVAGLGIAAMVASGLVLMRSSQEAKQPPPPPPTAAQRMWGSPAPVVVNRVIEPVTKAPKGLVSQPLIGYQSMDGQTRQPPYLFDFDTFEMESATPENGFLGTEPKPGLVALDTARLVVRVVADPRCFPQAVMMRQGSETVTIGVFYGQPNPEDGSNKEFVTECTTEWTESSVSTLIPLPLNSPLKKRKVVDLDGNAVLTVPLFQ